MGDSIVVKSDAKTWQNWAQTVLINNPEIHDIPADATKPVEYVQNIIKKAKTDSKQVRVSQYGHTWQNFFTDDNQILLCFREVIQDVVETIKINIGGNNNSTIPEYYDFWGISTAGDTITGKRGQKSIQQQVVQLGSAVSGDDIRKWSINLWQAQKTSWTVPVFVVMKQNSLGGTVNMDVPWFRS